MNTATTKPFGISGSLSHSSIFRDIEDNILYDEGLVVSRHNEILAVGFDKKEDRGRAEKIAKEYIVSWSFRNNIKVDVIFNSSWEPDTSGNLVSKSEFHESVTLHDRVIITVIKKELGYTVKQASDSYNFENDTNLVKKAEGDPTLSLILEYFYNEVMDAPRPKVGIYRILEELEKKLGGRESLARIVGEKKIYVDDIMQTVQEHRHSLVWLISKKVKVVLSQQECLDRTRRLIDAYIKSIA